MSFVGGSAVQLAIKAQAAKGAAATGSHIIIKHDDDTFGPQRIADLGRPQVGGGLFTAQVPVIYGAQPGGDLRGLLVTEYMDAILILNGFVGTPGAGLVDYVPAGTSAAWVYSTVVVNYGTGMKFHMLDARGTGIEINHAPFTAPTIQFGFVGLQMGVSAATLAPAATETIPSPAQTILAANLTFAGAASTAIYGIRFLVTAAIDNTQQPLGSLVPDDVVPNSLIISASAVMSMTQVRYEEFVLGVAAATAITATLKSGAMNIRVNAPAPATAYIQYVYSAGRYLVSRQDPIRTAATEQTTLRVTAIPTGTVTVTVAA